MTENGMKIVASGANITKRKGLYTILNFTAILSDLNISNLSLWLKNLIIIEIESNSYLLGPQGVIFEVFGCQAKNFA
jgi:hypothetical protein